MEQLIEILKELHPDVDYENCTTLITDKILDSFDMITQNKCHYTIMRKHG